jgi:hypothetical protein
VRVSYTLTEAREALAQALTAMIEDLSISPRPTTRVPKSGDGWVTVGRVAPSDFRHSLVTLVTVIILGADSVTAEELLELWAVDLIDVATFGVEGLPVADVSLEPITLAIETGAVMYATTLTLTTEVAGNG